MNCPNCNIPLVMSERQGIEIDYCPTCRGVWLDRGELDKIIEKSSTVQFQTSQTAPNPAYDQNRGYKHYEKHDDYYKYKKKNWLNELFD